MNKLKKITEWAKCVGQDRTLNESLAVYCLVSCGGWSALTLFYLLYGEVSIPILLIYLVISIAKGWLGMSFLTRMKKDVKNDRVR